jgi:hypothetical protein
MKRRSFLAASLFGAFGFFIKPPSGSSTDSEDSGNIISGSDSTLLDSKTHAKEHWKFVSMPDFVNRDVPWPEPKLDGILGFILDSIKAENPEFLLVLGDMVNGRWWMPDDIALTNKFVYDPVIPDERTLELRRDHLRKMAKLFHSGWVKRMKAHGLSFYVGVGDHELGDDPWIGIKKPLVRDFEDAFRNYYKMPLNGPAGKKGLSYSVIRDNCLFIIVDPFEQEENGEVRVQVSQDQLEWIAQVLKETKDSVRFRIVGTHTPILKTGIQFTASSRLTLPGETQAPLWQLMKKYDVDLFLCGEYHSISCQESDGILQVVHGALMGFSQFMNYLIVTVTPDSLLLEFKEIETVLEKPEGKPDRLSRIARISEAQLTHKPESIGTMSIDKSSGKKVFAGRTGIFNTRYNRYNDTPDNSKIN